jgi:hypothetical protein
MPQRQERKPMKSNRQMTAIAAVLAGAMSLGGTACAGQPTTAGGAELPVQTSAASHFEITRVRVQQNADTMSISGDVANQLPLRGMIPGHVEARVIGPDGATLATDSTDPMKRNRQARSAHFYIRLPVSAPAGSRVEITHKLG